MSAIGRMPPELFSAFVAGRHNAQAHEWLRKARDYKRAGWSAVLAVSFARQNHHDYLRELATATRTLIRADGSRALIMPMRRDHAISGWPDWIQQKVEAP